VKKAFICIDSLRNKLDTDRPFFVQRADYALFVTTIPVTRQDVADFRAVCPKAELAGYIDPFHLPLAPPAGSWWESWVTDLPSERWLTDAESKQPVVRFKDRGFYVHTFLTARVMARECALLAAKVGIDRMFFDDFDPRMVYRYDRTTGTTRRLRWGKGVQPYAKLQAEYVLSANTVLRAFENEFARDRLPIVNSGIQWIGEDGRTMESNVNPASFVSENFDHNYAIAYPWNIASLRAMIEAGTFPSGVGVMEDRTMAGPV